MTSQLETPPSGFPTVKGGGSKPNDPRRLRGQGAEAALASRASRDLPAAGCRCICPGPAIVSEAKVPSWDRSVRLSSWHHGTEHAHVQIETMAQWHLRGYGHT